jgi:hypothetical protein
MIKTFIIIFTQWAPNVDGKLQDVQVFSMETCQARVEKIMHEAATIPEYTAHARCETREVPKKK